ncbi:MAG: UbiA family prenyltransferase [Opitutales bacterium]|nr:UbiA family prenyltransferase [Opitutales bacterium]
MNSLPSKPDLLHQALTLGRVSNLPSVWTNCLAAWAINLSVNERVRGMPEWNELGILQLDLLLPLILGASLLYMGGCTLNDAADEKFDRKHNPHRPIPSGAVTSRFVWILGITEMLGGGWALLHSAQCETTWVLALGLCIIAYDIVHKKWAGGVFLMGGCRLLLWASAATCGESTVIYPLSWIWGGTLAFYVIGISLFARGEAKEGEDAPRISILFLFASPLVALAALVHWNNLDPIRVFLVNAVGLFIAWIAFQAITQIREGKKGAIGQGVSRLLAGICITDTVVISFCMPVLIAPLLSLYALALLLQKKFAAT